MTAASSRPAHVRIRPSLTAAEPEAAAPVPDAFLRADASRRVPLRFQGDGASMAGHLYRPRGAASTERTPGIVLCGPIGSVKELVVPHYAERLADAGYTVLTFDPRGFGGSEGSPRLHHDSHRVVDDYASAVSYLLTRDDVDPARVAALGVCMGGGHAVSLGARDKRLKAVVAIGGAYDTGGMLQKFMGVDGAAAFCRSINDILQQQYVNGDVRYVPAVAPGLSKEVPLAVMPNAEAHGFYTRSQADAPTWTNLMTVASIVSLFTYNAVAHAPLVAPTPLMVIHGTRDGTMLPEYAQQVFEAAVGPKELVWIETQNHVQLYDQEPYVDEATAHAIRWLNQHLGRP
ncbi:alpha/beta hydrolase [Corallococcus llansteffanensis]|nr:alpha/beta hydrolase [Corallococcus llansteffanensis]